MTNKKWPKLKQGQQIRIRNKATGQYAYKPKGSSRGWYWDDKFTLWGSWQGPGHIVAQLSKSGKCDNVEVEVLETSVAETIDLTTIVDEHRSKQLDAIEDAMYIHPNRYVTLRGLFSKLSDDDITDLIKWHASDLRTRGIRIHKDDVFEFGSRMIQKIMGGAQ